MARQGTLELDEPLVIRSVVLRSRTDFERLFAGFTTLRAISYVISPEVLLDMFTEKNYTTIELLVGDSLAEQFHDSIPQQVDVLRQLHEKCEAGALRVLVPSLGVIHSKFYILEHEGRARIINGSLNLTKTAREAPKQMNYLWYADVPIGHPFYIQAMSDFAKHCALRGCTEFKDDLAQLFPDGKETSDAVVEERIQGFLVKSAPDSMPGGEIGEVLAQVSGDMFEEFRKITLVVDAESAPPETRQVRINYTLPKDEKQRTKVQKFLHDVLRPRHVTDTTLTMDHSSLKALQQYTGVPLMRADINNRRLDLCLHGSIVPRAAEKIDNAVLAGDLELLESYMDTVRFGRSPAPEQVQASMGEALLAILAAPFASEEMERRRSRFGLVDSRGPRHVFIFGESSNGKTTFLNYVLSLIAGQPLQALSGQQDARKKNIERQLCTDTMFPLVFDDIPRDHKRLEPIVKEYWEHWWRPGRKFPLMVMSTNHGLNLPDWFATRVRWIEFDVKFESTNATKVELNRIIAAPNNIFRWFALRYLELLSDSEEPGDDELHLARAVWRELYDLSGRRRPDYYLDEPLEKTLDRGRQRWLKALNEVRCCRMRFQGSQIFVDFEERMGGIREYEALLPQHIKHKAYGHHLEIENPDEFTAWLGIKRSWLRRIIDKIRA